MEYKTVFESAAGEYTEKRSKFISALHHCESEEEAQSILNGIKSDNFGANHNVYAYCLRDGTVRFSDDKEPHGTAGKPVLEVLSGSGLTDVILVVTRYFGGVLLGTGGLCRAYTAAAQSALFSAKTVIMRESSFFSVPCEYSFHKRLSTLIEDAGGIITDTVFADKITLDFVMPNENTKKFLEDLNETFSMRVIAKLEKTDLYPYNIGEF